VDPGGGATLSRVNRSPHEGLTRTCPWCAETTVVAFTEESLLRALTRHLESCPGDADDR
jgi:hypothetical protein